MCEQTTVNISFYSEKYSLLVEKNNYLYELKMGIDEKEILLDLGPYQSCVFDKGNNSLVFTNQEEDLHTPISLKHNIGEACGRSIAKAITTHLSQFETT
jgi:hypothetical protein